MSSTEDRRAGAGPSWRILLLSVLLVAAVLALPLFLLRGLAVEHMGRANEAQAQVAAAWGGPQALTGPILTIPVVPTDGRPVSEVALLPNNLEASATMAVERRRRGLFDILLYRSSANLSGHFLAPDWAAFGIDADELDFTHARLQVGLNAGGVRHVTMAIDGHALDPSPLTDRSVVTSGLEAEAGASLTEEGLSRGLSVAIDLALTGSGGLSIAPVGDDSTIKIEGDWPHPEFAGRVLPSERTVAPSGFSGRWTLSKASRGYPVVFDVSERHFQFDDTAATVQIIEPVDLYAEIDRLMKYGFVVIALVFAAIGLGAAVLGAAPHPVEWLLAGAAVALSFLLTLALAEHVGFAAGYAVAGTVETAMVAAYLGAVADRRLGIGVGAALALVDTFLYFVLGSERYALLAGSIGLLLALAAAMVLTRSLDWNRLAPLGRAASGHGDPPPS